MILHHILAMTTTTAHRPAGLPQHSIRPYRPATDLGAWLQFNRQAKAAEQRSIRRTGPKATPWWQV